MLWLHIHHISLISCSLSPSHTMINYFSLFQSSTPPHSRQSTTPGTPLLKPYLHLRFRVLVLNRNNKTLQRQPYQIPQVILIPIKFQTPELFYFFMSLPNLFLSQLFTLSMSMSPAFIPSTADVQPELP